MKIIRKVAQIAIVVLLLFLNFSMVVDSKIINNDIKNDESKNLAKVYIFQCYGNNFIKTMYEIPDNEAINLVKSIQSIEEKSDSFKISFDQTISILKDKNLITSDLTFNDITNLSLEWMNKFNKEMITRLFINQNSNAGNIINAFCKVRFLIKGIGFVLGMHSLPFMPIGFDFFGVFKGKGSVKTTGGLAPDSTPLNGNLMGRCTGFLGVMLIAIIPCVLFPIFYGCGFTLFTNWKVVN